MGQFEDMSLFVRIVEAGGIGKASEQLQLAKSAVSRRLKELEEHLKTQLLNRTTRSWSLTEAGGRYYQKAKTILDDVSSLDAEIRGDETELEGLLNVALPLSFGLQHIGGIVDAFAQKHRQLKVQIDFSDRQVDLVEEGYDLAIRIANLRDSGLKARRITTIRHVMVASPTYLAERGNPLTLEELANHDFLEYNLRRSKTISMKDERGKSVSFVPKVTMIANNGDFLRDCAIAGRGVTFLPTFLVYEAISQGRLIPIFTHFEFPVLEAYAVYPESRFISPKTRALIDYIVDHCGDKPFWDQHLGF